jgi:tyrosine--tRNA ligase
VANLNDIIAELRRGVWEFIDEEKIISLIKKFYDKGEHFYVKIGLDPTAPDLHLGHTVVLQKMAFLQRHGAIIQFLIGDFTGQIGDPTGKNETRKKLSREVVEQNAQTYKDQVFKILDPEKTQIKFNSEWNNTLNAANLIELASTTTVARMLERDDFSKRYNSQTPISISEFLYPLLQGYDSVVLKSDIEMGGSDQKFNLLMGRTLQKIYNTNKEQALIMMPLLVGTDGANKMSKSLNNYIGVTENPNDMYGKILSISDALMWSWYELLSTKSIEEVEKIKTDVTFGNMHPKTAKELLALEIVTRFYNEETAQNAKDEFDKIHSSNEIPTQIKEYTLNAPAWIVKALLFCKLASSSSDARRLIASNAVSIDQNKIDNVQLQLNSGNYILQVGKRNFAKLKVI